MLDRRLYDDRQQQQQQQQQQQHSNSISVTGTTQVNPGQQHSGGNIVTVTSIAGMAGSAQPGMIIHTPQVGSRLGNSSGVASSSVSSAVPSSSHPQGIRIPSGVTATVQQFEGTTTTVLNGGGGQTYNNSWQPQQQNLTVHTTTSNAGGGTTTTYEPQHLYYSQEIFTGGSTSGTVTSSAAVVDGGVAANVQQHGIKGSLVLDPIQAQQHVGSIKTGSTTTTIIADPHGGENGSMKLTTLHDLQHHHHHQQQQQQQQHHQQHQHHHQQQQQQQHHNAHHHGVHHQMLHHPHHTIIGPHTNGNNNSANNNSIVLAPGTLVVAAPGSLGAMQIATNTGATQQHLIQQQQHQLLQPQQQQQQQQQQQTLAAVSVSSPSKKRKRPVKTKKKRVKEDDMADSLDCSVYPDDVVYIRAGSPNTALTNRHTVNISGINGQHDPKALRLLCPRPPHLAIEGNRQLAGGSEIGEDDGDDDDEFRTLAGVGVWEYGKVWNHHLTIKFLERLHNNKKRMFSRDSRKVLYMELSVMFQEEDHKEITTEELEKKWCSLLSSYKRNQNRMRNGEEVSWGYYKIMDEIMTEGKQIRRLNRERPKRSRQRRVSEDEQELRYTKATCKRKTKKIKRLLTERLELIKLEREESLAESEELWRTVKESVSDVTNNIALLNTSVIMLGHTLGTFLTNLDKVERVGKQTQSLNSAAATPGGSNSNASTS